jgi:hypothetical protein
MDNIGDCVIQALCYECKFHAIGFKSFFGCTWKCDLELLNFC